MLGDRRLEMPNFESMAVEAGAQCTLYKPFQADALFQAIQDSIGTPVAAAP